MIQLTDKYLKYAILTEKSRVDCRHIALASTYECEYIISSEHMANIKIMNRVQEIN